MTGYYDALAALQAARLSVAMLARDQEFLQVAGRQMILFSALIVALLLVFGGVPFMDNRPSNPGARRSKRPPSQLPREAASDHEGFGDVEDEFFDNSGSTPTPVKAWWED